LRSNFADAIFTGMETLLRYRGRTVTAADVQFIKELIAGHPGKSRRQLSTKLCEAWDWRQSNGTLRDMVCRGLMLALWRAGHIELPEVRKRPCNPLAARVRPPAMEVDRAPVCASLRDLGPLEFRQVRRTPEEGLFNSLLQQHHYLGYAQPVGEHLKFMVSCERGPVALFAWSSAARHLGPRDRYLGWAPEVRRRNIGFLAYNTRYLIPGWIQVPHLASHLLSRMTRMLPTEWEKVYGHPVYFAETFVDTTRHRGTCYRAANWIFLGRTQGRGKDDLTHKPNRTVKDVLGLALVSDAREQLLRV
jgi:hypothetical protein